MKIRDVDVAAKCPHCGRELEEIWRIQKGFIIWSNIYLCPFCRNILSVGVK